MCSLHCVYASCLTPSSTVVTGSPTYCLPPTPLADQTVEEYLKSHCNQLVEDLTAHAEGLIQSLQQELEKGKAEIMGLARGGACVRG